MSTDLLADHKMLGKEVTYEANRAPFEAKGTVTGAQHMGGCMVTEDGTYKIIRFRIKPTDGSRAFWTGGFADRDHKLSGETNGAGGSV